MRTPRVCFMVRLMSFATAMTVLSYPGGLAFTPDGKRIAAGLEDTSIVIWDVRPAH